MIPKKNQIIKTVIGFCNLYGGRIIIGVDNSGKIVGVPETEVENLLEYLHRSIYESCTPPVIPEIYTQRVDEKLLIIVRVSSGMNKPYSIKTACRN